MLQKYINQAVTRLENLRITQNSKFYASNSLFVSFSHSASNKRCNQMVSHVIDANFVFLFRLTTTIYPDFQVHFFCCCNFTAHLDAVFFIEYNFHSVLCCWFFLRFPLVRCTWVTTSNFGVNFFISLTRKTSDEFSIISVCVIGISMIGIFLNKND